MTRLHILSNDDFDRLYKIPQLTNEERQLIFELDENDKSYLNQINTIPAKINYILHLGYFRISQYFFSFNFQDVKEDVKFILKTYFPENKFPDKQIGSRKYYENRKAILSKYEMILYSKQYEKQLSDYLKFLVIQHAVPKYLFDSLLDYCHRHKIIRPSYSVLQGLVSTALQKERSRLNNKLYTLMDNHLRKSLDELLEKNDLFYQLTSIKKEQKDFSTHEIRETVEKNKLINSIYYASIEIIKQLKISEQNIAYYADLAMQYTVHDLQSFKQINLSRLYLLCYVYYRFLKINDHLIFSFMHKINGYINDADIYQKDSIYKAEISDQEHRNIAANILSLHTNKKVADTELRKASFAIVPEDQFPQFIQNIRTPHLTPDYYRWQYYKDKSHAIKQNIRLTFKTLKFQTSLSSLEKAISFLLDHFNNNKSFSDHKFEDIPIEFIPPALKRYVILKITQGGSKKKIKIVDPDCYEFMIYMCIQKGIQNGVVTIKDSLSYKSLNDELISNADWLTDKEQMMLDSENHLISLDIEQILNNFKMLLNNRYGEINQNIESGINNKIKIKYNKKGEILHWTLPYKKRDDSVNNEFFDTLNIANIGQIIKFTNHHTNFLKYFTHLLPTNSKNKPEDSFIAACVVAKGTGIDIHKMKDISDIKEQDLISTYHNFIRHKTITGSSDKIMNDIAKLPIFSKYTLADYGIHASVDGQKLETKYNIIKARYSSKYYGLGKGISAYTLFANCLPLCTKIIGANEHESQYLLDILESNTSDIEISGVSGDMHSINRVNFILLYMFCYKFMPRFMKLDKKASKNLVSFDDPKGKKYDKYIIKPSSRINEALILKEKDNILRIIVTLALKKNTQANIVKKLASYKSNDTLKALIELNKIVMSLYMLDYIDDEGMRKCVHRSLNRGESYHQLRSAIAKVSGRKLIGKTEIELIINNECARLIAICIIFYNASLLSGIYEHFRKRNMLKECAKIIRLSPIAWIHINLIGKYEFSTNVILLDLDSVVKELVSSFK
jgi:TnpA family transposase